MTKNQIEYWKLQEQQRSNRENERISHNKQQAEESIGRGTLGESVRHNRATEANATGLLHETTRHNLVGESNETRKTNESIRHNKASEGLTHAQNVEMNRHNVANENETRRSNYAKEYNDIKLREIKQSQEQREQDLHGIVKEGKRLENELTEAKTLDTNTNASLRGVEAATDIFGKIMGRQGILGIVKGFN